MASLACYVGLMSGTSADAVDVVAVNFEGNKVELIARHSFPLPSSLRIAIHELATPANNEIDRLGQLDQQLGHVFTDAILQLLQKSGLTADQVQAIGSHGQTIRHRPPGSVPHPFTLQIGDPNIVAQGTRITTVADFRRRDMAAGGQGAPLVPAFHRAIFHSAEINRVVVNIGGMANLTWLPKTGRATGFDTGPGNVLMDAWIFKNLGKAFDTGGQWAASGQVHDALLQRLLNHSFFLQEPPKSTGREAFNLEWITTETKHFAISAEDIQATLLALTATSISREIEKLGGKSNEVLVCGGGAYNLQLMGELQRQLPDSKVVSTETLGVAPECVEAMAFAWLARQTINRQSGNLCAVTGANEEVILGGVYFA